MVRDENGRYRPDVNYSISILPLSNDAVERIGKQMTTCRFIVKDGVAYRHGYDPKNPGYRAHFPKLPGIPDGTYEFQNGVASRILFSGIAQEVSKDHPLYQMDAEQVQFFYNLGIEFFDFYKPSKNSRSLPSRYAYFRDNQLYLLGAPILERDDPYLVRFLQREYQKQSIATSIHPYHPFEDSGPPVTPGGKIDVDFIKKHGLSIPEKMYLVLGDNHAMSADSRAFGFVPQDNLRGGPSVLFWPPGHRWGRLPQPPQPHFTVPNVTVWGIAILAAMGSSFYVRRRFQKPLKF
jgi:signal peptidase I